MHEDNRQPNFTFTILDSVCNWTDHHVLLILTIVIEYAWTEKEAYPTTPPNHQVDHRHARLCAQFRILHLGFEDLPVSIPYVSQ